MRSSSIKSAVLALTVTLTLTAIAPAASARTTRSTAGTPSVMQQFEDAASRATTAARRLLTRFFGPMANALPAPPLPAEMTLTAPRTEDMTTTTTTKARKP